MRNAIRISGVAALMGLTLVSFQNCGKGFKAAVEQSQSSSSLQCRAAMKAQVSAQKIPASELRCSDLASYLCERRVFSPDVADLSHVLTECAYADRSCVTVEERLYNTGAARAGSSAEQFRPGGDYNREEIRCYHKYRAGGSVVFEADGDSLAEALSRAMSQCEASEQEGA